MSNVEEDKIKLKRTKNKCLKKEVVEEKYRIINDLYQNFSYEIATYGTNNYDREGIKKLAREIRLELRKFI